MAWDGVEKRNVNWEDITKQLTRLEAHFESEFGNHNTTGNLTRRLENISLLLEKQNGRVKKLEIWQAGVVAVLAFVTICLPIMGWVFLKVFHV